MQLGDLYIYGIRPDKGEKIYLKLLEGGHLLGSPTPGVEGYAILQLANALDLQSDDKRPLALEWLKVLSGEKYARTYWGPFGMFRLALFTFNQRHDPKESIPLYKDMFTKYPTHPMAEYALCYYCLDTQQLGEAKTCVKACEDFLSKYSKSEFVPMVQKTLAAAKSVADDKNKTGK